MKHLVLMVMVSVLAVAAVFWPMPKIEGADETTNAQASAEAPHPGPLPAGRGEGEADPAMVAGTNGLHVSNLNPGSGGDAGFYFEPWVTNVVKRQVVLGSGDTSKTNEWRWLVLEYQGHDSMPSNVVVTVRKEPVVTANGTNGTWTIRFPNTVPADQHAITSGQGQAIGVEMFRSGATIAAQLKLRNPDWDDVQGIVNKAGEIMGRQMQAVPAPNGGGK